MIAFACHHCQTSLRVEQTPGQRVKCPRCLNVLVVPESAPVATATLPPEEDSGSGYDETIAGVTPPQPVAAPEAINDSEDETQLLAPAKAPGELGWLGPYRVLKVLGRGGMGVVFHAIDAQLDRPVALKAILPRYASNTHARERFFREARAAAKIKHDNIVAIYQVGEDRGIPYLAMEFLEGQSLDQYMKRKKQLPIPEVLRIGRDIANGLADAHARNLIHRDIKPANIWLEKKKSTGGGMAAIRVKILDFGLARDVKEDTSITHAGTIVGSPAYMAPEQAHGLTVDSRCDLFGLGCLLYRLSTGRLPFRGDHAIAILAALATETPDPPDAICPDIPKKVSSFLLKLLEKDPNQRPASARQTAETLGKLLRECKNPASAETITPQPETLSRPAPRRRLGWWIGGGAAGLFLLVLLLGAIMSALTPRTEPKSTKPVAKLPAKADPSDDEARAAPFFGKMTAASIDAESLTWAFGANKTPRELVGLFRNRTPVPGADARLGGFTLSPDGRWLAQGGPGLQVDLVDLATGQSTVGTRSSGALGFFFSSNKLFTGSPSTWTRRDLLSGFETSFADTPRGIEATAFGSGVDVQLLLTGTSDGRLFAVGALGLAKPFELAAAHEGRVAAIAFKADTRTFASGGAAGDVIVWSTPVMKTIDVPRIKSLFDRLPDTIWPDKRGSLRQLTYGPNGNLYAAFDGAPSLLAVATTSKTALPPVATGDLAAFAFSRNGERLATLSPRGKLLLWSFPQKQRLGEIDLPPLADAAYGPVHFTPDGHHVLIGHPRGAVIVLRV